MPSAAIFAPPPVADAATNVLAEPGGKAPNNPKPQVLSSDKSARPRRLAPPLPPCDVSQLAVA